MARARAIRLASPVPRIASACTKESVMSSHCDYRHCGGYLDGRAGSGNLDLSGSAAPNRARRSRRGARCIRGPQTLSKRDGLLIVQPPLSQSVPDTRTVTGRSAGNPARTASNTLSGKHLLVRGNHRRLSHAGWTTATGTGGAGNHGCMDLNDRCRAQQHWPSARASRTRPARPDPVPREGPSPRSCGMAEGASACHPFG